MFLWVEQNYTCKKNGQHQNVFQKEKDLGNEGLENASTCRISAYKKKYDPKSVNKRKEKDWYVLLTDTKRNVTDCIYITHWWPL